MNFKKLMILVFLITVLQYTDVLCQSMENITRIDEFLALSSKDNWQVVKEKNGVILKYRWLYIGDSIKTRELLLSFETSQNINEVVRNIKDPYQIKKWNGSIRSQKTLKDNDSSWVSHSIFDIPYPFTQQDLIVVNSLKDKNGAKIIYMYSIPDFMAQIKNIERQKFYLGSWVLTPKSNGVLVVKFSAISLSKSKIPRFIRDPIIFNRIIQSFVDLKERTNPNKQIASSYN